MISNNRYKGIDNFTIKTIRTKATDLIKKRYFLVHEQEDLEQELIAYLLTRLPLKDITGTQSKAGIIKKLVDEKSIHLIRNIESKKRRPKQSLLSLDDPINNGGDPNEICLMHTLPETSSFYEEPNWSETDKVNLQVDIGRAIKSMPPPLGEMPLGELCDLLQRMSVNDISELKGISTNSLYRTLSRVRKIFLEKKLKIYA